MVTYTYRNGSQTEDLFYFIDAPGLINSITGNATAATISDGVFGQMRVEGSGLGWSGTTPNAGTVSSLEIRFDGLSYVTVTDLSLPFNNFTLGTYRDALAALGATHTDAEGDATANFMQGGAEADNFYSRDGNDTLSGGGAADNFFVTERVFGNGSALDIRGGGGEDTVYIADRGALGDVYVNLSLSTLSSIEGLSVLNSSYVVLAAAQGAGLGVHLAAGAAMTVMQTSGVALNLNTLFAALTRGGGTAWLSVEGTGIGDRQVGATGFNNSFYGRVGDDTMSGANLQDELYGGEGNDSLVGNGGSDNILGDLGYDTLVGGAGSDVLTGGQGDDVYRVDADDAISEQFGEGADWVEAAMSLQLTDYPNIENGRLLGGGAFALTGTGASNELTGNTGANVLTGFGGRDTLSGGDGNDQLLGDGGNDHALGGLGDDRLDGGEGSDALNGEDGDDSLYGGSGEESLMGGAGDDQIYGGADYDGFYGGDGNDALYGGGGNDQISGEAGSDTLSGGAGDDFLSGGQARDTFVFSSGGGRDEILGFVTTGAASDKIDLRGLLAVTGFADLTQNHMVQVGADVQITAGSDVLVLLSRSIAQLDATDFVF